MGTLQNGQIHPTNCLGVFDHFVGLALKGLKSRQEARAYLTIEGHNFSIKLLGFILLEWLRMVDFPLNRIFARINTSLPKVRPQVYL